MRMLPAFYVLGWALAALAGSMIVPISFALAADSIVEVQAFTVPAVAIGFVAGCMIIAFRGQQKFSSRRQSLLLLALLWTLLPVAAALPFFTLGAPPGLAGALFEATSGLTTSGATVIVNLGETPTSIIVWRALLQWMGGLATLVALAALLGPLSGSTIEDRQLRFVGHSAQGTLQQLREAIATILPLYGALTAACFILLSVSAIPSFDAFCLSLAVISTGGFMPSDGTVVLYGSPFGELVLAIFMTIGAISIIWLRAVTQMRWSLVRDTREPFVICGTTLALGVALAFVAVSTLGDFGISTMMHAITVGLASAAALISTTGLRVSEHTQADIPYVFLLLVCIVGGGRFSTAGGLKVHRIMSMLRQIGRELRLLVFPHGVRPSRFGGEAADVEIVKAAWITMTAFAITIAAIALMVAGSGVGYGAALMAAVGAVSNMGPVYDFAQPENFSTAPTYAAMSPFAQLSLCLGMILGRFEILSFLSIFLTVFWKD